MVKVNRKKENIQWLKRQKEWNNADGSMNVARRYAHLISIYIKGSGMLTKQYAKAAYSESIDGFANNGQSTRGRQNPGLINQ